MLGRTLRADFRHTRATSLTLAGLIALAALLAATGGSVLAQLTGAVGELFRTARTPDVVQMHLGALDPALVDDWARARSDLEAWQVSRTLPIPTDLLYLGEEPQSDSVLQPALVTQNSDFDLLLDGDGQVLDVGAGEIALPLYYRGSGGVELGDAVSVRLLDQRVDFTVVAFVRDSMMNPTFATSKRLLVSDEDFAKVAPHIDEPEYLIEFLVNDPAETSAVSTAYSETGPATNGPLLDRSTFFLLNAVSHGVGIAVLSVLAVGMVAVAAMALRFSLLTAVERDLHEIGAMKAVGIPDRGIRRLYLTKYVALALVGGLAGAVASVPAARAATASLRLQLGDPGGSWWLVAAPVLGAGLVVAAVAGWCALVLRRLGRISTMDALRANSTAGRARLRRWWPSRLSPSRLSPSRPSRLHLAGSRLPVSVWLGLNDVRRQSRTHRTLVLVLAMCTFLAVVPLNLWTTVRSPSFVTYLGAGAADLRLELRSPEAVTRSPALVAELARDPDVERLASFAAVRVELAGPAGDWEQLPVETGDHDVFPLQYLSGASPQAADELALSTLAADSLGVAVGDVITLRGASVPDVTGELAVVGIYQDMTNGGRTAKGRFDVPHGSAAWQTVLLDATGAPRQLADRLSAEYPEVQPIEVDEYVAQTLGDLRRQAGEVAAAAAVVAVALAALISAMFAQLVIARDRSQLAVQRGLGAPAATLRGQYLTRFATVLLAGIALGTVLVATVGRWLAAAGMGLLGAPALRFDVEPLLAHVAVPLALAATVAAVVLSATRSFDRFGIQQFSEE